VPSWPVEGCVILQYSKDVQMCVDVVSEVPDERFKKNTQELKPTKLNHFLHRKL
jgi:hypothetical protein